MYAGGKSGIDISGASACESEQEILLLPWTLLKVKSISTININKDKSSEEYMIAYIKFEEVGNKLQT